MHSWRILILPYIEQQELYDAYHFDEPWDGPNNRKLAHRMPHTFAMAQDKPTPTITNYLAVVGSETAWPGETIVQLNDIDDGCSNTILFVEHQNSDVHWMEPRDLSFSKMKFQLNVPGGFSTPYDTLSVALVDGCISSVEGGLPAENFRAMVTIDGQDQIYP